MSMKTILCAMLAVGLSVSSAYAEPSVKRSGSTITVKLSLIHISEPTRPY